MKRVYFLRRADGQGPIKIGCSACPEARRKQIGCDLKAGMALLAVVPGDFRDEGRLHRQFAALRVKNEWFRPAPELLRAVDWAARTGRLPPASEEDRDVVFARRYLAGETLEQIAADNGITRERVRQLLRKSGIPSLGHRKCHLRYSVAERASEKIVALTAQGWSAPDIADAIGDSAQNVRHALRRHGVEPIKRKKRYLQKTLDAAEEVARLYLAGEKTRAIAEAVGTQQPTIYRLLRLKGIEPSRGIGAPRLDADAVVAAYRNGATMREIAVAHGCTTNGISKLIQRNGAGLSREEIEQRRRDAVRRANARRAEERQAA